MTTMAASFTATGNGNSISVKRGDKFTYTVTGTFVATWVLEKSESLVSWEQVATGTGTQAQTTVEVGLGEAEQMHYRFRCSAYTSGTLTTSLDDAAKLLKVYYDNEGDEVFKIEEDLVTIKALTVEGTLTPSGGVARTAQQYVVNAAGHGKVGATAGFVVAAADDIALVTCPASQTAATLVIPLPKLKVGDTITAFSLVGQVESAGNTVTVDADLRKHTAAASDVSDASVGAITQASLTSDTILSASNTEKASLAEVVGANETFYVLVTVTTAAATDVALQGVLLTVTEA